MIYFLIRGRKGIAGRRLCKKISNLFLSSFRKFAGVKGTERYDSFASGQMQYLAFLPAQLQVLTIKGEVLTDKFS